MTIKKHSYQNDKIKVSYDGSKCSHAGFCFKKLNQVFDGDRDPPIDLDAASIDDIVRVVEMCPSSALVYERLDGGQAECAPEQATVTLIPDGPLAIRGRLVIGEDAYSRLTLCRCGQSKNKPFCDGSHAQHRFDTAGTMEPQEVTEVAAATDVTFRFANNGPAIFSGSLVVQTKAGDTLCVREKGGLCRCGASKNKPFCDGSHKDIGFVSDQ